MHEPWLKWQKDVLEIIDNEEPNDREIIWCFSEKGGVGKTSFAKYLAVEREALVVNGKAGDIFHAIVQYNEKNGVFPRIVVMNVPKVVEHLSYNALESIKDGLFYSGKYEGGQAVFNSPHLIVFANVAPEEHKMTNGRFRTFWCE